jgi:protein-disulfide isomerase
MVGVASLFGWYQATKKPEAAASATASASDTASLAFAPVTVTDGQGLKLGYAGAVNVVTIYSDFACTHCAEFETTYGQTLATLQTSGQIAIEYWPLGFGSAGSARASNAMACAAERDPKFAVSLYDGFFANMGYDWSNDQIMSMSTQLQPTLPDGYEACVTGGTHAAWVTGIYTLAKTGDASGGTPAVYVNGKPFDLTTGTVQTLEASLS